MWTDFVIIALLVINLALLLFSVFRRKGDDGSLEAIAHSSERVERSVREEFGRNREETSTASRELRAELTAAVQSFGSLVLERMGDTRRLHPMLCHHFSVEISECFQLTRLKCRNLKSERRVVQVAGNPVLIRLLAS